jgi:hypothetical protein
MNKGAAGGTCAQAIKIKMDNTKIDNGLLFFQQFSVNSKHVL